MAFYHFYLITVDEVCFCQSTQVIIIEIGGQTERVSDRVYTRQRFVCIGRYT